MAEVLVAAQALAGLIKGCFEEQGISEQDAGAVAEVLLYADLRGLDAHGVHRLPAYMERVRRGLARGAEHLTEAAGEGPVRRLDADFALGPAAAVRATDMAILLAREHGVGAVGVGRSTHLGAAGFYVRRAACQELVALVISNGPSGVAPHGAAERFLGTNPLAIGIPLGEQGAFVLDMSTAMVPRERIRRAQAKGAALPIGVALDQDGRPTRDPSAALEGSLLPFGGPKGSGLGLAISLMAGMLGLGDFDPDIGPMESGSDDKQNVGHLFCVLDPWRFGSRDAVLARTEGLIDRLRSLTPAEGFERVKVPGEGGEERARKRRTEGIPVETELLDRVAEVCERSGCRRSAAVATRLGEGGS